MVIICEFVKTAIVKNFSELRNKIKTYISNPSIKSIFFFTILKKINAFLILEYEFDRHYFYFRRFKILKYRLKN
jgi:hypothetical protein